MTDAFSQNPGRRTRYHGKNPRRFHERYKEHQPDQYALDVAKVIAGGKTPAGTHRPIMVAEVLQILRPQPGQTAVDCTLGYGGHAQDILAAIQPGGRLLGLDSDPIELPKTEARLRSLGFTLEALLVKQTNYAGLRRWLAEAAPDGVDLLFADLGLSSMQIDDPDRGFSYKVDGPLDMRMNPSRGRTASELLSSIDKANLARLLSENADEFLAPEIAEALLIAHARSRLTTTQSLAKVVKATFERAGRRPAGTPEDSVKRVFQALRIAVNDEFAALEALLRDLPACLKPGARAAILTFHSGEDRRVKAAFRDGHQSGVYSQVSEEVTRASPEERRANPRSSSAKLRFAVRVLG